MINSKLDIFVIGGGAFGTTLASTLANNSNKVAICVRTQEQAHEINQQHRNKRYLGDAPLAKNLEAICNLEEGIKRAKVLLMAIPAQSFRSVAAVVGEHVMGDQIIVHATKGLELGTYKTMSEIIREETCVRKIGVLSGPNLAKELIINHPSGALVASRYPEVWENVQKLFLGSPMKIFRGKDVIGTEIAGSFKNIVALAAGIADGMGYKDNTKSLIVTRGFSEMARYGAALGADPLTFGGLAGIGDLMATCHSTLSRNRSVGEKIGQGENWQEVVAKLGSVAEGVPTTKAVYEGAQVLKIKLPIVESLYNLLYSNSKLDEITQSLMTLPSGFEISKFDLAPKDF